MSLCQKLDTGNEDHMGFQKLAISITNSLKYTEVHQKLYLKISFTETDKAFCKSFLKSQKVHYNI